jgi:hypothetical protein
MSEMKFTKTATFLFPLLQIPKSLFDCNIKDKFGRYKYNTRFINAYLEDSSISKYKNQNDENYVFVVVRGYQDVDFSTFYSTIQAFPNYVDNYDYKGCCVIVFSVSKERIADFNLIIKGAYSQISTEGKRLILSNSFYSGKMFTLPLILNKAQTLKDSWEERLTFIGPDIKSPVDLGEQEVWPIIDYQKEVLTKEIVQTIHIQKDLLPSGEF